MRLSVSNIAWKQHDDPVILAMLRTLDVSGIELAPTKIWPEWIGATPTAAAAYGQNLRDEGFEVPAFQSILFSRNDIAIFGDAGSKRRLVEHVHRVVELAHAMGACTLVFGSPQLRDPGQRTWLDAQDEAVEVFARLAETCAGTNVAIGLEPNPPEYGCRFATSTTDVAELVLTIDQPGLRVHLDSGQMAMTGEAPVVDAAGAMPMVCHVHASEPWLAPWSRPVAPHHELAAVLRSHRYDGWVSLEMRHPSGDVVAELRNAVQIVKSLYFG